MPLSVLISEPERKKERTDAHANDREVYVSQLSRFAVEIDLERLFSPVSRASRRRAVECVILTHRLPNRQCGAIKRINIGMEGEHCKGFAFVEFEEEVRVERTRDATTQKILTRLPARSSVLC